MRIGLVVMMGYVLSSSVVYAADRPGHRLSPNDAACAAGYASIRQAGTKECNAERESAWADCLRALGDAELACPRDRTGFGKCQVVAHRERRVCDGAARTAYKQCKADKAQEVGDGYAGCAEED